ncbi:hypothetical protein [Actinokineospora terrae]|uniref:Uncharacterized protein n=1 Tax=Actinokineospora terrae TaxID=155974 RepID=A0A1H9QQ39_9PSEU|nr:hypothetical protein [Actinokineospora terrae]SER61949.1 hypothetical protein SAMN04487818_104366 [Actinokineospora terrae]
MADRAEESAVDTGVVMDWTRDPSELPPDYAVPVVPRGETGYWVRNDHDWPARICGSLSLTDVVDIARGLLGAEQDKRS